MRKRKGIGTRAALAIAAIAVGFMVQFVGDVAAILLCFPLHYVFTLGSFGLMSFLISRWTICGYVLSPIVQLDSPVSLFVDKPRPLR